MPSPTLRIDPAVTSQDLAAIRGLFLDYQAGLGIDLGFQSFDEEIRRLPGDYAPPTGRLLLATWGGRPVGCVALRGINSTRGEMKRLFIQPQDRGLGVGKRLIARLLQEARAAGYEELVLDTLPGMTEAQGLYLAFGFHDIPPYRHNPIPGSRFLGLALDSSQ
jgi:ribosomal protein S18 acetylase RimI-like enzyme